MSQEYTERTEQTSKYSALSTMIIVIFLCLVSLVGATYALFTSNPDDGRIGVVTTSGNVKVDIVTQDEKMSLINEVLEFEHEEGTNGILFEPGATFYTKGFKAKNIGDIPINFRMYISDDEDMDMAEFEEAFEFYITTDPKNPDATEKLHSFTGRLEVGESSDTYYLVIKMKESANNDFQGYEYTGIGITVCAVQGNVQLKRLDNNE